MTDEVENEIVNGEWWFSELVKDHEFQKGTNHTTLLYTETLVRPVRVQLPVSEQLVDIPAGTKITFFQSYPPKHRHMRALTIFFRDKQITIHGNGRIVSRRYV